MSALTASASGAGRPRYGFIGWGPESQALLAALRSRDPDVESRTLHLASGAQRTGAGRALPSLEALFREAQLIFAEGGQAALEPHLSLIRLAISDRHVLVLLGGGWSVAALLETLRERKVARCMLLPGSPGRLSTLAFYASPYLTPEERTEFRVLFAHLELVVELRDERHFDVLQGLADFAPAAFYTVMEAMADGVVMMGFSRAAALQLLASLLHGAAQRVLDGDATPGQLREQALEIDVAAAGLIELESAGIRGALMRAMQRAVRRPRTAEAGPPALAADEPLD